MSAVPVMNNGSYSLTASTTLCAATSRPKSIASNPPALKNIKIKFLPMSWGSPSATKHTTVPFVSLLRPRTFSHSLTLSIIASPASIKSGKK